MKYILSLLIVFCMVSCGRYNALTPPTPEEVPYPRQYPANEQPQP